MTKKVEDLTDEQLDVLVAEKVTGWNRDEIFWHSPLPLLYYVDCPPMDGYEDEWWSPTTNIAHAFQVDKPEWEWFFGEKGDDLHANVYVASEESGVYTVVVPLDPANKTAAYCRGRCIAACYACGITEV